MIDFATAYPNSRKVYEDRTARLTADGPETTLRVPVREVALGGGEPSLRLYDTSGPQGHDVRAGLPKLRAAVDRRAPRGPARRHAALLRAPRRDHAGDGVRRARARGCPPSSSATRSRAAAPSSRRTSITSSSSR